MLSMPYPRGGCHFSKDTVGRSTGLVVSPLGDSTAKGVGGGHLNYFFSRAKLNNLIASTGKNPSHLPQPPAAGDREGPELPLLLCALPLIVFAKRQRAPSSSGKSAPHQPNEDPL